MGSGAEDDPDTRAGHRSRWVDLGTGVLWWLGSTLTVLTLTLGLTAVGAFVLAGAQLMLDAAVLLLWIVLVVEAVVIAVTAAGIAVIDGVGIALGLRPLWRRVVLTALLVVAAPLSALAGWWVLTGGR